jgi:hypothetical protein
MDRDFTQYDSLAGPRCSATVVFLPRLCRALRRLASNWRKEVIGAPSRPPDLADNSRDEKTARLLPQAERRRFGINVDQQPCFLIHLAMQLTVMDAAKRDGELVADFAAERPRLHKPKVVRIARLPTTHQTRQGGDEIEVFFVANPPRPLGQRASATSISAQILR